MRELIEDLWTDGWVGRSLLIAACLLAVILPIAIYGAIQEQIKWDAFAVEHHCADTGNRMPQPAIYVKSGDVLIPVAQPDKVKYHCDDEKDYWR